METNSLVGVVVDLNLYLYRAVLLVGKSVVAVVFGHADDDAGREVLELLPTTSEWENAVVEWQPRPATAAESTIAAMLVLVGIVRSL
jgi:IS1 family transposase